MKNCDKNGFGGYVSKVKNCYAPENKVETDTTLSILLKGLWKTINPQFSFTPTKVDSFNNHGGSK
ncbi:MAG: hypothetical protein DRP24_07050 [Thermotoga sp.]|nr:MAG: hypothetical protein DRP24_07050 [Thermotoga sp.]